MMPLYIHFKGLKLHIAKTKYNYLFQKSAGIEYHTAL